MKRNVRGYFYGKKRGHRRTGSEVLGSAGEALFFGFLLLLGCVALVLMVGRLLVPEWRVNHEFTEDTCIVLDRRLGDVRDVDGAAYDHREPDGTTYYKPEVLIRRKSDGQSPIWAYDVAPVVLSDKAAAQKVLDDFEPGKEYRCWYDPLDTDHVVLVRGYTWWLWLIMLVPVSFIVIGGVGLVFTALHWGTSAERRASLVHRATHLDLFEDLATGRPTLPFVPAHSNLTNSPGTTLAYRLPVSASAGWHLLGAAVICLFWNGIVSAFVVSAVNDYLSGQFEWRSTLFLIPFMGVGLGFIYYLVRQVLIMTAIGPTLVEISDHPLYPGVSYEILVSQAGRLKINLLEVALVCDEEATFRQGTDSRTDLQRVFYQEIVSQSDFEIQQGTPFERRCVIGIPLQAMHSFRSEHNSVNWKLIVQGDIVGWPRFERSFPVVIYPKTPGSGPL